MIKRERYIYIKERDRENEKENNKEKGKSFPRIGVILEGIS